MNLTTTWRCMGIPPHTPPCDAHGDQDREAERHLKQTGHSTSTETTPAKPERRPR